MSEPVQPREIVRSFARRMEQRLNAHDGDHRPGWHDPRWDLERSLSDIYTHLKERVGCLTVAVLRDPEQTARITADIGNYAMMIADLCGALTPEPLDDQGRQLPVGATWAVREEKSE